MRAETDHHVAGFAAAVDAHARIALFLGKMEVPAQLGEDFKASGYIAGLGLDFLHANTIRRSGRDPGLDAFGRGGADAVEVEAG
ncbi:hypothetical protein D3C85_1552880 [compost metagenome]